MKKILLGIGLFALAWTSMQANSQPVDGVEVYFTDKETAFELVSHSRKQLISLNEQLNKMRELAIQAVNSSKSGSERSIFDEQYQNLMSNLDKTIQQTITPTLQKHHENEIVFLFYTANRLSGFALPDLDAKTLGINSESINIATKQNAKQAITQLRFVISWLESKLPDSTKLPTIVKSMAIGQTANNDDEYNQLTMPHKGDRQKVLAALVKFRDAYRSYLFIMVDLAERVLLDDLSQSERNVIIAEFQQYQRTFDSLTYEMNLLGNIRLFNNNKLEHKQNGINKLYSFDKITMSKLNLRGTSLINVSEAQLSIQAVDLANDFVKQLMMQN